MKTADGFAAGLEALHNLRRVLMAPSPRRAPLVIADGGDVGSLLKHGFHSHDSWELFAPLRGNLCFEAAGRQPVRIVRGQTLLVPPECLHQTTDRSNQASKLNLLIMNFPGEQGNYGSLRVGPLGSGGQRLTLAAGDLNSLTAILGEGPAAVMDRVAQALCGSVWSRERARGMLWTMLAAFAEIVEEKPTRSRRTAAEHHVGEVLAYLQTHYFEPDLTLAKVGAVVGMSPSHLSNLFRQVTGSSIRQTVIEIRLRRALVLLKWQAYSIKQIAGLTGWNNQLYFSAAFRRRYGTSPSQWRNHTKSSFGIEAPPAATMRYSGRAGRIAS